VQEFEQFRWNLNAKFSDAPKDKQLKAEMFDLINSRFLAEGINASRWRNYIRELRQMLKPGGWLQMAELQLHVQSSSGRLSDDSCLTRWWNLYVDAMTRMGKDPRIGPRLGRLLQDEHFSDVRPYSYDVPIGDWKAGRVICPKPPHVPTIPNDEAGQEDLGSQFLDVFQQM
jgi:hypothetical protein